MNNFVPPSMRSLFLYVPSWVNLDSQKKSVRECVRWESLQRNAEVKRVHKNSKMVVPFLLLIISTILEIVLCLVFLKIFVHVEQSSGILYSDWNRMSQKIDG